MTHEYDIELQSNQLKRLKTLGEKARAEANPEKPFKPQRIDLTPDEPMNIGYVGGLRMPKSKEA